MKKLIKFMSLFLSLALVLSVVPGAVFAATEDAVDQEPIVSPRASYTTCSQCGRMTLQSTSGGNIDGGENIVSGCAYHPNMVHMHHIILGTTNHHCSSCGYSSTDYRIIQSICLA